MAELITNFNELITAPVDWKASYAKVAANLNSLLGPDTMASAAGTAGMTDSKPSTGASAPTANAPAGATPPAAGTAGAVGTSGTATATIDAAVRAKLMELRQRLTEFERAAGGAAK